MKGRSEDSLESQTAALLISAARRVICTIVSVALALNPIYQVTRWASAVAFLASPLAALAQTQTPPPGAADGQALGQSLLQGPSTDGNKVYWQGANGTESIDTSDLYQNRGSADDAAAMMKAFGDDPSAQALAAAVTARLSGENSEQANAYNTITSAARATAHPDLSSDPMFNPSQQLLTSNGTDPVFSSFFSGCTDTQTTGSGPTVHVPDPQYCQKVVMPTGHCDFTHEYTANLLDFVSATGAYTLEQCGPGCLDIWMGPENNGKTNIFNKVCAISSQTFTLSLNSAAITSATLQEVQFDDYGEVDINNTPVYQGPWGSFPTTAPNTKCSPYGCLPCENATYFDFFPGTDLTSYLAGQSQVVFTLKVNVSGDGTQTRARVRILYDEKKAITKDKWNITPECQSLLTAISDGVCTAASTTCTNMPVTTGVMGTGGTTVGASSCTIINGVPVCESDLLPSPVAGLSSLCQAATVDANCAPPSGTLQCWTDPSGEQHCPVNDGSNPDGCASFENNASCGFVESSCLPFAVGKSGQCYAFDEQYDCGYSVTVPGGTTHQVSCDGPVRCMGESCVSPPQETNPDFAQAAATLSALTFMGQDMNCVGNDPSTCRIFAGEAMSCKRALGGYQNCCDEPVSVGIGDYLHLLLSTYDLAKKVELGEKLANAGLNIPGAWQAVENWASSTWSTITGPFTSAWSSLVQSYGGDAVNGALDSIESFSLSELKQELMNATATFVSNTFGPQVAGMFFQQTGTDAATGEPVYGLSEGFATALSVVMWVYTVYIIVTVLINIIWKCEQQEFLLAARRKMETCTRVGTYCAEPTVVGCIETKDVYCCYNSPLARIVMEGAAPQLGTDLGTPQSPNCQGLTIAQMANLDWSKIDLSQWYAILATNGIIPNGTAAAQNQYSLENVTQAPYAPTPTPNAPQRVQSEVDAAQFFDHATSKVREDLWNGIR